MNDIKLQIALAYKVPRVTNFILEDIKLMKKLNQIFQRFEKYEKDIYILEVINVLKQLDNVFDLNALYPVLCVYVDIRFHSTLILLFEKINCNEKIYNIKLKELVKDDDEEEL
jgi:hypothetical protein